MAVFLTLTNPYRPIGAQEVTAYCVARISDDDPDARRCLVRIDAYDGPCTKEQRSGHNPAIKPFAKEARGEIISGDLYDAYFSVAALESSNPIKQAYLCSCRSIIINGEETNIWHTASSDVGP